MTKKASFRPNISAQIYNFLSHQTELQFQLPHEDYALSPDLNQYLFEDHGTTAYKESSKPETAIVTCREKTKNTNAWHIDHIG
ncbi:hypothetical protein [Paenibacillus tyrfis]|uniref:hypothetical protein n=1 Tax=Paenibacillus tyrfis TaxID=1501230 RepID=UPI00117D68DD|nr:hypothetical protein [Paenibacillus tyrfis]